MTDTSVDTAAQTTAPIADEPTADRTRFGPYGGIYVPETLIGALRQLDEAFQRACNEPKLAC